MLRNGVQAGVNTHKHLLYCILTQQKVLFYAKTDLNFASFKGKRIRSWRIKIVLLLTNKFLENVNFTEPHDGTNA